MSCKPKKGLSSYDKLYGEIGFITIFKVVAAKRRSNKRKRESIKLGVEVKFDLYQAGIGG